MENINEKRLAVLKVALESLRVEQTKKTIIGVPVNGFENAENLEGQPFVQTKDNKLYALIYVINHLKREFDDIELSKELQELKEQNIQMALENIHKTILQEVYSASDFAVNTKILGMLRKSSFEGL